MVAELAKISFNSCLQEAGLFFIGADDEDGVISCDGAHNFGPVFVVDSGGDGLGASGGGHKDKEIDGLTDFEAKAFKNLANSGQAVLVGV